MNAKPCLLLIPLLLLAACERRPGAPEQPAPSAHAPAPGAERISAIRRAAVEVPSALEVMPLRDPAVDDLLAVAYRLEDEARYRDAAAALEQARVLAPESPEVKQRLAENAFYRGEYEEALRRALDAYRSGPRLGGLCLRQWLVVAEARAALGDPQGEAEARARAAQCAVQRPPRF
jgi:tetratricopeptide (TPR) repeat protein